MAQGWKPRCASVEHEGAGPRGGVSREWEGIVSRRKAQQGPLGGRDSGRGGAGPRAVSCVAWEAGASEPGVSSLGPASIVKGNLGLVKSF